MEAEAKKKLVRFQSPVILADAAVSSTVAEIEKQSEELLVEDKDDKEEKDKEEEKDVVKDEKEDVKDAIEKELYIEEDLSLEESKKVKVQKVEDASDEGFASGHHQDTSSSSTPSPFQKDEESKKLEEVEDISLQVLTDPSLKVLGGTTLSQPLEVEEVPKMCRTSQVKKPRKTSSHIKPPGSGQRQSRKKKTTDSDQLENSVKKHGSKKHRSPVKKLDLSEHQSPVKKTDTDKRRNPLKKTDPDKHRRLVKKTDLNKHGSPVKNANSDKRRSPVKKPDSDKHRSPAKKNDSDKRGSPVKKTDSDKRGSPVKKTDSDKRGSPVKKTDSDKRRSPIKKTDLDHQSPVKKNDTECVEKTDSDKQEGSSVCKPAKKRKNSKKEKDQDQQESEAEGIISIQVRHHYDGKGHLQTKGSLKSFEGQRLASSLMPPPPSGSDARQSVQWAYDTWDAQGTWIECCDNKCRKWRFVQSIRDPSQVPAYWTCSMNPGPNHAGCADPERRASPQEEIDLIASDFTAGSLVWARQTGYPWWPSLVDYDPDSLSYFETGINPDVPVRYHVTFLDPEVDVSRAWIKRSMLKSFQRNIELNYWVNTTRSVSKFVKRIEDAKRVATEAVAWPLKKRLETYGFVVMYRGVINRSAALENLRENVPLYDEGQPLVAQDDDGESSGSEDLFLSRIASASQDSRKSSRSVGGRNKGTGSFEKHSQESNVSQKSPRFKKLSASPPKRKNLSQETVLSQTNDTVAKKLNVSPRVSQPKKLNKPPRKRKNLKEAATFPEKRGSPAKKRKIVGQEIGTSQKIQGHPDKRSKTPSVPKKLKK